jgi:aspartyl-tRNA(Asn)/glutamyl-tRNA(Gln) amidotransferase subunit A
MELFAWPAHRIHAGLAARQVSAVEVATAVLDRIEDVEGAVRAFVHRRPRQEVLEDARRVDAAIAAGAPLPPLAGVPVALKDNLSTTGMPTTCGSRILGGYVPPFDATVVEALRRQGAVFLGKTNMDEFAMGSSTEHAAAGPTHNPWDLTRVPGGSSGGSAAAVAAGETILALGSDTGGSIRQPAAFCGVVGLKPTYGRVSRFGLVAFASSLDQIGPLSRDVRDAAVSLQVLAGQDPRDATSSPVELPDLEAVLRPDCRGVRLGVPRELFGEGVSAEVRHAVAAALDLLAELGASIAECSLPALSYALDAYYVIAPAEASSNLARFDGVRFGMRVADATDYRDAFARTRGTGFGPEVRRRIMLGTYALSAGYYEQYYGKAQQVRTMICRAFDAAWQRFDALVGPTAPTLPFALGEKLADPLQMYMSDVLTVPINLAGLPAISLPCGFHNGLPVGLQVVGRAFDEATVLRVAYAYEQAAGLGARRPPLARPALGEVAVPAETAG